ncbi:MAG: hypothetical protein JO205_01500 [Pseudolabrys sp.]|nr:hypothetical protein [Pseudolabrys sp.]MBV9260024.1 hypothetical protein [Pseudolabrys sp.]
MTAMRNRADGSRPAEPAEPDQAFEGQIREFVRRDVAQLRRPPQQPAQQQVAEPDAPDNVNALIWRVSGASMEEIDRVILELQGVRDMLRQEGERVTREVAGYASLNHAANTAMKVIAESLAQWKNGATLRPPAR